MGEGGGAIGIGHERLDQQKRIRGAESYRFKKCRSGTVEKLVPDIQWDLRANSKQEPQLLKTRWLAAGGLSILEPLINRPVERFPRFRFYRHGDQSARTTEEGPQVGLRGVAATRQGDLVLGDANEQGGTSKGNVSVEELRHGRWESALGSSGSFPSDGQFQRGASLNPVAIRICKQPPPITGAHGGNE